MVSNEREKWRKKQASCSRGLTELQNRRMAIGISAGSSFFWKPLLRLDEEEIALTRAILKEASKHLALICCHEDAARKLQEKKWFLLKKTFADLLFRQIFSQEADRILLHLCLKDSNMENASRTFENVVLTSSFRWDDSTSCDPLVMKHLEEVGGTMGQVFRIPLKTIQLQTTGGGPVYRCEAFFKDLFSKVYPDMKYMKLGVEFSATRLEILQVDFVPCYSLSGEDLEELKRNGPGNYPIFFYCPLDCDKVIHVQQIWNSKGGKPPNKEIIVRPGEVFMFASNVCLSCPRTTGRSNLCIKGVLSKTMAQCKFACSPKSLSVEKQLEEQYFGTVDRIQPGLLNVLGAMDNRKRIDLLESFSQPLN